MLVPILIVNLYLMQWMKLKVRRNQNKNGQVLVVQIILNYANNFVITYIQQLYTFCLQCIFSYYFCCHLTFLFIITICDCILENQRFCHISYFEKY